MENNLQGLQKVFLWPIGFINAEKQSDEKIEFQDWVDSRQTVTEDFSEQSLSVTDDITQAPPKVEDGGQIVEEYSVNEEKNRPDMLEEAIKLHELGIQGDKEAVIQAYKLLSDFVEHEPENIEAWGYLGSITTMLGRDAINPTERMNKTLEGLKILDQVINSQPDNIQNRSLRAHVCYNLPEMYFHRTKTAIEDFNYLISRYEENPSSFSQNFYWNLLYDLGIAYKNINKVEEARKTWLKLIDVTSDINYMKMLKNEGLGEILEEKNILLQETVQKLPDNNVYETDDVAKDNLIGIAGENDEAVFGLEEGIKMYTAALSGDKEAVVKSLEYFENAHRLNPHNELITAYYADCLSMSGRDSKVPMIMFENAIKAMKLLDQAVNYSPDNIEIRKIRAYHSYRLPEGFFRRTATAIADFEYMVQQYEENDQILPRDTYWRILYDLGICYRRLDMEEEAAIIWDKLLSQTPYDKYHDLIEKQQQIDFRDIDSRIASLNTKEKLLQEGIHLHDIGVAGNKKATKKAHDIFERLNKIYPEDPVVLGYYASSIALLGRDSNDSNLMFSNAIKGMNMLKQAISKDNTNVQLRLLRGYLLASLPDAFFPLSEKAIKDLRFVKNAYEQGKSEISEELYCRVLYDLGNLYQNTGGVKKCQKTWKKLLAINSDSPYKKLVDIDIEE
ncbi:MAG: hypothetical protein ACOYVD_02170 [Bacillota bacterium]